MILDSRNSDALRRIFQRGGLVSNRLENAVEFTLSGVMEFLASAMGFGSGNPLCEEIRRYVSIRNASPLQAAWDAWHQVAPVHFGNDIHGVRNLEFYRLRERSDQTRPAYQLFQERLVRSLKAGEFPGKFASALAGVLVEMTDNVVQHSLAEPGEYQGLAGYQVEHGYVALAVTDVGQGILGSLSRAPAWSHLKTADQALRAAVCEHASSRPDQPEGEGFRTVFKSLAERNCRMRFRSGDAVLTIEDAGGHHDGAIAGSPPLRGFQVSIFCALKGTVAERAIFSS